MEEECIDGEGSEMAKGRHTQRTTHNSGSSYFTPVPYHVTVIFGFGTNIKDGGDNRHPTNYQSNDISTLNSYTSNRWRCISLQHQRRAAEGGDVISEASLSAICPPEVVASPN
ncbi:hypothetical protein EVAR_94012_1 [Eumeta japonica]|uniref:Uncharacterized protein n=1 Tax=Eumeta variegata TaxID=151549 RepID=A0A4C1TPE3_EUMVA|nr:hypothetical protein EVAR_94012_1 [Eumeta japonica]